MSQREIVYYIDPNNELWIHRRVIQKYMEEYLDGKARLANDEETENIICLTKYKVKTNNKFKFSNINQVTLAGLMGYHASNLKLEPLEVLEFFKMGLSKDLETRTLGINTLIKHRLYEYSGGQLSSHIYTYSNYINIDNHIQITNFKSVTKKAVYWLVYNHGKSDNPLHKTYELSIPRDEYLGAQLSLVSDIIRNKTDDTYEPIKKIKELIYEHIRTSN